MLHTRKFFRPTRGNGLALRLLPRRTRHLTNIVVPEHEFIRGRWRAVQIFRSFDTVERTLGGIEAIHKTRKGRVKRLVGGDVLGQAKFVEGLLQIAA